MAPGRSDRGHAVLLAPMDITRRQALGLGAAALGALRFPASALATHASGPDLFELPLGRLAHARRRGT